MKGIDFFLGLLFFFFQDTGSIQLIYGIIRVVMVPSIFLITIVISPVTQELLRTACFSSRIHGVLLSFFLLLSLLTSNVLPCDHSSYLECMFVYVQYTTLQNVIS